MEGNVASRIVFQAVEIKAKSGTRFRIFKKAFLATDAPVRGQMPEKEFEEFAED